MSKKINISFSTGGSRQSGMARMYNCITHVVGRPLPHGPALVHDEGGILHDLRLGALVAVPPLGAVAAELELVVDEVGGAARGRRRVPRQLVLVEEGDARGGVGFEVRPRRARRGHGLDVEAAAGDEEGLGADVAAGLAAAARVGVGGMEGLGRRARQDELDGPVGRGNFGVGLDVQLALHVHGGGGDGEAGALGDCQLAPDVEAGGARQVEVAGRLGVGCRRCSSVGQPLHVFFTSFHTNLSLLVPYRR